MELLLLQLSFSLLSSLILSLFSLLFFFCTFLFDPSWQRMAQNSVTRISDCTLYILFGQGQCIVCAVQCIVYHVHFIVYTVHCIVCNVQCILYHVQCIV